MIVEGDQKIRSADYKQMQMMLFGDVPPFDELMEKFHAPETAINKLTIS
jgi:hypothetical protein